MASLPINVSSVSGLQANQLSATPKQRLRTVSHPNIQLQFRTSRAIRESRLHRTTPPASTAGLKAQPWRDRSSDREEREGEELEEREEREEREEDERAVILQLCPLSPNTLPEDTAQSQTFVAQRFGGED
jgi:hypothetical protein